VTLAGGAAWTKAGNTDASTNFFDKLSKVLSKIF
jgi:hypothetical protein